MMFDGLGFIRAAGQTEAIDVKKYLFLCSDWTSRATAHNPGVNTVNLNLSRIQEKIRRMSSIISWRMFYVLGSCDIQRGQSVVLCWFSERAVGSENLSRCLTERVKRESEGTD